MFVHKGEEVRENEENYIIRGFGIFCSSIYVIRRTSLVGHVARMRNDKFVENFGLKAR
jgi:hypothetical protein